MTTQTRFGEVPTDAELRHPAASGRAWKEAHFASFTVPELSAYWEISETPADRRAEAFCGVLLGDGSLVFLMDRGDVVEPRSGARFDVGSFALDCQEPLERWSMTFADVGRHYDTTGGLTTRGSYREVPVRIDLDLTSTAPAVSIIGGQTPGKYEQPVRVTGDLRIGDVHARIDGAGMRDHTWGARTWTEDKRWTWVAGSSIDGPQFTLMSSLVDGELRDYGWFRWPGGAVVPVTNLAFSDNAAHRAAGEPVSLSLLVDGTEVRLVPRGAVRQLPLRHREGGLVSDILQSFTFWDVVTAEDTHQVAGQLEHLSVQGDESGGVHRGY